MSRPLAGTLACVALVCSLLALACRPNPGLDIVRVPATAYLAADAAGLGDARDAAPDAAQFMLCISAPASADGKPSEDDTDEPKEDPGAGANASSDEDMSDDFPDCPKKYQGRNLDPRVTQRHRDKDDEHACCYRERGSPVQPKGSQGGRGE